MKQSQGVMTSFSVEGNHFIVIQVGVVGAKLVFLIHSDSKPDNIQ